VWTGIGGTVHRHFFRNKGQAELRVLVHPRSVRRAGPCHLEWSAAASPGIGTNHGSSSKHPLLTSWISEEEDALLKLSWPEKPQFASFWRPLAAPECCLIITSKSICITAASWGFFWDGVTSWQELLCMTRDGPQASPSSQSQALCSYADFCNSTSIWITKLGQNSLYISGVGQHDSEEGEGGGMIPHLLLGSRGVGDWGWKGSGCRAWQRAPTAQTCWQCRRQLLQLLDPAVAPQPQTPSVYGVSTPQPAPVPLQNYKGSLENHPQKEKTPQMLKLPPQLLFFLMQLLTLHASTRTAEDLQRERRASPCRRWAPSPLQQPQGSGRNGATERGTETPATAARPAQLPWFIRR